MTRGEIKRLAIHMPPRHGKTESVTVRYPVYRLERDPSIGVLVTGYNVAFARRLSRKARRIAGERGLVAEQADDGSRSIDEWHTPAGGFLMARGVGSPPTGVGFQLIVIDDPIRSRSDADSPTYRENAWDWYTDDLATRLEADGAIVMIATRWHHDDVCARAVAAEPGRWTVLSLPAIAEDSGDALGRAPGEALWPERWPVEALTERREIMRRRDGEASWESLYQQRPSPAQGSYFRPGLIEAADVAPANLRRVRAWDAAASPDGGDYTAGVLVGGPDREGLWWILDVVRGRWDSAERDRVMRQTAQLDGPAVSIRVPQDPGAAGKSQAEHWVRLLAGYATKALPVTGAKVVRAGPAAAQVNAGNVRMLRGPWNGPFVEELRQFPAGAHDDQVDAFADAFDELASVGVAVADEELYRAWR